MKDWTAKVFDIYFQVKLFKDLIDLLNQESETCNM